MYLRRVLFAFALFFISTPVFADGSDITASAPTPTTAYLGIAKTFTSTISNIGVGPTASAPGTPSGFPVLFSITYGDTVTDIGTYSNPMLNEGGSNSASVSYTFSSPGRYYLTACGDRNSSAAATSTIPESNELNNCNQSLITVSTIADLTAGSVTPTSALSGVSTTFSATIYNNGTETTRNGFRSLFQRAGALDDFGNAYGAVTDLGFTQMSELTAGGTNTASFAYSAPSDAGTFFYMRVCADKSTASDDGAIGESSEANNCGAWTRITTSVPSPISGATCSVFPERSITGVYSWQVSGVTGGNGNYTYTWSGDGDLAGKTTAQALVNYTSGGIYNGNVTVADSAGNTPQVVTCSFNGGGQLGGGPSAYVSAATLYANGSTEMINVTPNSDVTLTWESQNTGWCIGSGFDAAEAEDNMSPGVTVTAPASGSAPYQIHCGISESPNNVYSNIVTINSGGGVPNGYITVNPPRTQAASTTQMSWSASNITGTCRVIGTDQYDSGEIAPGPDGSIATTTVSQTINYPVIYVLSCPSDAISTQTAVNVVPTIVNF